MGKNAICENLVTTTWYCYIFCAFLSQAAGGMTYSP